MFNLKKRAATLTASFKKPTAGFNSNKVNCLNLKLSTFLFLAFVMLLPADLMAQIEVGGEGETFQKFKDLVNDQVFPAIKIIALLIVTGLIVKSGFMLAAGDPKWMSKIFHAFLVAVIFYGGPTILAEIIDGWDLDYGIE